ncbi:MAG TPA: N-6 DNA methylase [Candidatus Angelobacter sp.]|jgi:hypothetical protein|nr:N-6 DNA methylase [Candidatus Angelobacter sp.]
MSRSAINTWRNEFGIASARSKDFFGSKADLDASGVNTSQGHVLRRAFDLLHLDGVLCTENIPLVYFKQVKRVNPAEIARLHKTFWNHGGAPVLVIMAPDQIQIYSGLVRPLPRIDSAGSIPSLVDTLEWASAAVREFLPTVESGQFFQQHAKSFDPAHRVDRDLLDNLQATRTKLAEASRGRFNEDVLDALLCRLVFVCYLFDREPEVIGEDYLRSLGLRKARHLRDVLGLQPKSKAKSCLYDLFRKLGQDFNGDLFSDDLNAEEKQVPVSAIGPLDDFFRATNIQSGQASFWPYDFSVIPVEAISAIYERFLKGTDRLEGAFYTPRFLAEVVLDVALAKSSSLLELTCLDPACGSGIFLVGLFNRMAEEWKLANPNATNDRRARELRKVLCNLYGIDVQRTACRITAFSLYLAYLDQLSPRDIRELQQKGHKLPRLVHYPGIPLAEKVEGNIWCGDFFEENNNYPKNVNLVIGNPPWGSTALPGSSAAQWCTNHQYLIPDNQISAAFVWKAPHHLAETGRACLVLPHGTIFNHSSIALEFQRGFFKQYAVDHVLNLVDYQFFLFEEARHPAIVLTYQKKAPKNRQHSIEYWAPKTDWLVTRAEVIAVMPEDRCVVTTGEVLDDLEGKDAPQIWKQRYWPTERDRRLIDRLSLYPRLRDHVRQLREKNDHKPWVMAVGIQPVRQGDDVSKAETIQLPSPFFIKAKAFSKLNLFLLPEECTKLSAPKFTVRSGSNKDTTVFNSPHVLVTKGFTNVAFADFAVSFQDFLRGIHGPEKDREFLIFLAAYLRSTLARYYLFHTSQNWGITRQQIHVDELQRLPFPLPNATSDPVRAQAIVKEVAKMVVGAAKEADALLADRNAIVERATASIEPLVAEYFDLLPIERVLVNDTIRVIIPSVRPSRKRTDIPTIKPSTEAQQSRYVKRLCETLNGWARTDRAIVQGKAAISEKLGIGVAILQKTRAAVVMPNNANETIDLLAAFDRLRTLTSKKINTLELVRGAKVFDQDRLYLVKPTGQRFWTETAALNDADEIAGTILMNVQGET